MRELARVKSLQYIQKMKRQGYEVADEEVVGDERDETSRVE